MHGGNAPDCVFRLQRLVHQSIFFKDVAEDVLDEVVVVVEGPQEVLSSGVAELLIAGYLLERLQVGPYHSP